MSAELTIAIAQTNPTVGDVAGNLERIRSFRARAAAAGADLVVFSELVVVGYPPEDLVLKTALQDAARAAVEALAADTGDGGPAVILGAPWVERGQLYNAMLLLRGGEVVTARYKHDLPNYGVFDEKRVFAAGAVPGPMAFPLPGGGAAADRRPGLRGHVDRGRRRGARGVRRRDPDRAQRLALRARQARSCA